MKGKRFLSRICGRADAFFSAEVGLIALLMVLLALPAFYPESYYRCDFRPAVSLAALAQSFAVAAALSLLHYLWRKPWVAWTLVGVAGVFCYVDLWLNYWFFSRPTDMMLALVGQTTDEEASEFLSLYLWRWPSFVIALIVAALCALKPLFCWLLPRLLPKRRALRYALWGSLSLLSLGAMAYYYKTETSHPHAKTTIQMWELALRENAIDELEQIDNLARACSDARAVVTDAPDVEKIVLVIGESHSRLHSSIYGYPLPTMPFSQREIDRGNMVAFDSATSDYIQTHMVIREMYSLYDKPYDESWSHHPLMFPLFKQAGYKVYLLDNQSTRYDMPANWDRSANLFVSDARIDSLSFDYRNKRLYKYDQDMIEADSALVCGPEKAFVLYHIYGQHMKAKQRVPKGQERFCLTDYDYRSDLSARQKEEVMHYDNATWVVDANLGRILDMVRDKSAVVVYCSDHGEEVHDFRDRYGRTSNIDDPFVKQTVLDVPMTVWYSDEFIERNPALVDSLRAAAHRPFSNSRMALFLLGIAGITSEQPPQ